MDDGLANAPAAGTPVELRFTKYDGSPHWEYDLVVLGVDAYGVWLGGRPGDLCRRIGRVIDPGVHWVTLVPAEGAWVATFNEPGGPLGAGTYVDITDQPRWVEVTTSRGPGLRMTCADLDLDVVRRFTGECYIDDEDEFADHQVRFGYPADLVAATRATADRIFAQVRGGVEPFGGVGQAWLRHCAAHSEAGPSIPPPPTP
ncbi:MAG: DUF402 domain-containing protein [Austwickia sp.]|jgi:predicted RNA-binding protein associated with RNAse of E/G family|nr:MAG: DUF402 domain-containing protein [Austwickia sp.]